MNAIALLGLGLLLGMRHALDPDHVVAVGAIAARTRRTWHAAWLGIVWGLGHTTTLFAAGGAILLLGLTVPPRLGLALEMAVAIALVVVGALNLGRRLDDAALAAPRLPAGRAFALGIVHGLAGSAAVALLVLATVHDRLLGCVYLLVFGLGTLVGMTLVTTGVAAPLARAIGRWPGVGRGSRVATGWLSIALGVWLIWQIGWQDGLFTAAPSWTPH